MKKILGLFMILTSLNLFGAEEVTMDQALSIAYDNNYDYQNAKIDKESVDLQVKEGYKSAAPRLDYRGGYNLSAHDDERFHGNDGAPSNHNLSHQFTLTQPIYNGGTVIAGVKIAKKSQELMGYKLTQSKSTLKMSVISSYLKVIAQEEVLKVHEKSLEEVKSAYEKAKRKYELDLISKSEFLPLKAELVSTQADLIEAENQKAIYILEFKNLIGMDSQKEIELKDIEDKKYDLTLVDVDADINYAVSNNKESKISELTTSITEEKQKVSRADLLPKINATLAYAANDNEIRNSGDKWQWVAGIEVNWRIFDFGKSFDAYERSKNDTKKAQNNEKQIKEQLEVNIRTNYINLVKLNGIKEARGLELESSQENYDLQKKKYNEGIISITDYLLYETKLNDAKLAVIKNNLDYYFAYEKYNEDIK